jgi:ABC-type branched-subunit amino acid transport system substrate-binding protein
MDLIMSYFGKESKITSCKTITYFLLLLANQAVLAASFQLSNNQEKNNIHHIGILLSLSGPQAKYGHEMRTAIEIALAKSSNKQKFKFHFIDDKSTHLGIREGFHRLKDKVKMFFGSTSPVMSDYLAKLCHIHKKPLFIPFSSSSSVAHWNRYVFMGSWAQNLRGKHLSHFIQQKFTQTETAILVNPNDTVSHDLSENFIKEFSTKQSSRLIEKYFYSSNNEQQLQQAINSLVEKKTKIVFLPVNKEEELKKILDLLKEDKIIILGPSFWHGDKFQKVLKTSMHEIYYPIYFHNELKESKWFVDDFFNRSQKQPSSLAAMTYDSMQFILNLSSKVETNKDLSRFFRKQKEVSGILGKLSMSKNRFMNFPAVILRMKDAISVPEKIISF